MTDGREIPFGDEKKEGQNMKTSDKYQEVEIGESNYIEGKV